MAPDGRYAASAGGSYLPTPARATDGYGNPTMDRRITPRSPRAALEPEHLAVPTHRSKRTRNPLVIIGNAIFTLLVLLVLAGGAAVVFGKLRFEAPGPLQADKVVTIPARYGLVEIADLLQREGVIDEHRIIFIGGVFALKARSELKSGEYLFPKRASVRDVVETMVEGKVVQHLLTIPEGLTSEQIAARLLDSPILIGSIRDVPREGSLLPNSYNFRRGDTRELAIQRMQQAQQQILKEAWERRNRDLPVRTPEQLVILASIVEKETSRPEERSRVAAVFVNRLKQKMRLQTDPTVIYGLAPGRGTLGRPLTRADLERPTPYNTYLIDALPPGPIANPGRASIEAAANPARTKELYFVADGTGGHAFAETYDQHLRNVSRLRAIERGGSPAQSEPDAQPAAGPKAPPAKGRKGNRSNQKQ
jgi:peptidoglycan lytic transglycosylase G